LFFIQKCGGPLMSVFAGFTVWKPEILLLPQRNGTYELSSLRLRLAKDLCIEGCPISG
jgi:hypothetical protein